MNSLLNKLIEGMQKYSEEIAVKCNDVEISYQKLNANSLKIANKINTIIVGTENPIIIYMERGVDFVVSIMGVLRSGNYYIPIEKPYPKERIKHIIKETGSKVILVDNSFSNELLELNNDIRFIEYENIINEEINEGNLYSLENIPTNNLCYAIYTSGSTGTPKGVGIQYDSLIHLIGELEKIIYSNINYHINVALVASLSFDASIKQIFCALLCGHTLVIVDVSTKQFGRKLVNFFNNNNIYLSDMTPTILRNILLQSRESLCIRIRYFLIGGEVLFWEDLKKLFKKIDYNPIIINLYGPTECCVDVSAYKLELNTEPIQEGVVSVGKPLGLIKTKILKENGKEAEANENGELIVYGVCVSRGYINHKSKSFGFDEKLNMKYYHTGDKAYKNEEGLIYIEGRLDDQIKIYGNRVQLKEIEIIINNNCKVKDCSIVFYKNTLYCFFVPNDNKEKFCITGLEKFLPYYMIPKYGIPIKSIPINKNGKVDKQLLISYIKQGKTSIISDHHENI